VLEDGIEVTVVVNLELGRAVTVEFVLIAKSCIEDSLLIV
jgi:hypothetical protein